MGSHRIAPRCCIVQVDEMLMSRRVDPRGVGRNTAPQVLTLVNSLPAKENGHDIMKASGSHSSP